MSLHNMSMTQIMTSGTCIILNAYYICRIDDNEFIMLNLEVPLTTKQPQASDSVGAYTTLNMGAK